MNSKELLKALRSGTVPREGLSEILVGNEEIIKELLGELEDVKKGISAVRFIQGEYGSGKTMLTSYIAEEAISAKFCISQIVIDPNVQLGNFSQVYNAFCRGLRIPGSGEGSGLVNILEEWSMNQLRMYKKIEGITGAALEQEQIKAFQSYLETELISVRNLDPSLSKAISAFAGGKIGKNSDLWKYALDWIRANDSIPSRDFSAQLGLKGKIGADDAYNILKGILFIVKEAGYSGTMIVLDEVETVRHLPVPGQRKKAYEILRHIIDDVSNGQFVNSIFLVTATPDFFTGKKGISEYEALELRIKQLKGKDSEGSYKQPIIALRSFQEPELLQLAFKIRKIHGEGENWNIQEYLPDTELETLTSELSSGVFGIKKSGPRDFIRQLTEKFDLLKESAGKEQRSSITPAGTGNE